MLRLRVVPESVSTNKSAGFPEVDQSEATGLTEFQNESCSADSDSLDVRQSSS